MDKFKGKGFSPCAGCIAHHLRYAEVVEAEEGCGVWKYPATEGYVHKRRLQSNENGQDMPIEEIQDADNQRTAKISRKNLSPEAQAMMWPIHDDPANWSIEDA